MNSDSVQKAVRRCAEALNERFRGKKIIAVCILKGAVFFYVDLIRLLNMDCSCYFIEATSYHDNQHGGTLSIMSSIEPSKFAGREVVLIDELYDNGHTLLEIRDAICHKAQVPYERIFTTTLFRKNKKTACPPPDLFGAWVPDVWLVGCGLDDKQEKRGWTSLWGVPKTDSAQKTTDDRIFTDSDYRDKIVPRLNMGTYSP
jgi:hypoxanthine phosphoribosyltransferase